jgi:hypothetical protein
VRHNQPQRLFVRPLSKNAARSWQAEHRKPALAMLEAKMRPRCELRTQPLRSWTGPFRTAPDFRRRFESYPLYALLVIVGCAHCAGAPQGPCDRAAFSADLSQPQRRARGIRRHRQRRYPAPRAATFCRVLHPVDALKVEEAILAYQRPIRGPAPTTGVVALDGKEPLQRGGQQIVSAVNVPDLYYLGREMVETKTPAIPVARTLRGRTVFPCELI